MFFKICNLLTVGSVLFSSCDQASAESAQPTPKRAILALSKADHTLAIVDPTTLKVITKLPVGSDPHEVVASADGKTAYVSNYGSGRFHELNVLDLSEQKALPSFDTGAMLGPHGLTFVGGKVWFTAEGAKAIGRFDPTSTKIDWIMGTGQNRTHMIIVSADEKTIYTTNVDSGTVSIFENVLVPHMMPPPAILPPGSAPSSHERPGYTSRLEWLQTVIPGAKGNEGFDISPDGKELWTAAAADGTILIVDLAKKSLTATVDARVVGANRLKFSPDGKLVLISSLRSGDLTIYDAETRKELKRLSIGHGGAGILMDPDETRAFVSCSPDNYIAIVDLKKLEVTGHLDVGGNPDGLNWAVRH